MGYVVGRAATIGVDEPALYVLGGLADVRSPGIARRAFDRLGLRRLVALVRLFGAWQARRGVAIGGSRLRLLAQGFRAVRCGGRRIRGLDFCAHNLMLSKQFAYQ